MKDSSWESMNLLRQYNGDSKAVLRDHPDLECLYALSDMRENLLEWFPFREDASLLQVGSDYGALTGLYSRRVSHVTVLDPSWDNLLVNRERWEKNGNITYIQGGMEQLENLEGVFDYIVFAGTLGAEESSEDRNKPSAQGEKQEEDFPDRAEELQFSEAGAKAQLAQAVKLLAPQGVIFCAAANPLGIKYQTGAKTQGCRMTRSRLVQAFQAAGEGTLEFYYPMPDWKIPITIYSDGRLPQKGELSHQLMAYDYPRYLRFEPGKVLDMICEENQFPAFANSFLVIWSSHEENKLC